MSNKSDPAFTLAEVLSTLLVIGVVAALAVPALMTNIQDAQLKTSWKKAFSDLSQATMKLTIDHGRSLIGIYDSICSDDNCRSNEFKNDIINYMSFAKTCDNGRAVADGCWYSSYKFLGSSAGTFNTLSSLYYSSGILVNGNLLLMRFRSTGTGYFVIDVNGSKPPNTAGKDVFYPNINTNGSLTPLSNEGARICDLSNTTTTGYGCSSLYLLQ